METTQTQTPKQNVNEMAAAYNNDELARRLESIGGKRWTKGGRDRVYFNDLQQHIGLEIETYKTGNVAAATLAGEAISNNRARRIAGILSDMSLYYDVASRAFYYHGALDSAGYCQDALDGLKNAMREALS